MRSILRSSVFLLLAAAALPAQVQVLYSPAPSEVLRALRPRIGLWTIRACNDGAQAVSIPPERVFLAAPTVRFLAPEQAATVLAMRAKMSTAAQVVRYLEWGAMGATVITGSGLVAASTKVVSSIAIGATAAHTIGDKLTGEIPALGPIGTQLTDPIQLAPGGCATRVAFAALMKSPAPAQAVIK